MDLFYTAKNISLNNLWLPGNSFKHFSKLDGFGPQNIWIRDAFSVYGSRLPLSKYQWWYACDIVGKKGDIPCT